MANTRERARKARRRLQDGFRCIFPKVQKTLKKGTDGSTQPRSSVAPALPPLQLGMSITVTVRFEAPLQEVMNRSYNVTEQFDLNEDVVGALTQRIEHCTNEMITRPDAAADVALRHTNPQVKPARYHVLYQVNHNGQPVWDRYYTSYQHTAVTRDGANDIMFEVDRIIAMFLVNHDTGFVWHVPELGAKQPHTHKTTAPEVGKPQDTHCVPTVDEPAYSVDVAMRTKINGRDTLRAFKVDSEQSTPLTLQLGENMISQLSSVIRTAVEKREDRFWEAHAACDGLEGRYGCRHVEEGAFELIVRVRNNLGPDYNHLADRVQSHRRLVIPQEAFPFLNHLQEQVEMVRGLFDDLTNATEDLVVTVHDLRSHNWMVNSPMKIVIDSAACRDRITTEKLLERLHTGMFDVLKGHGTAAFVTAHKRGHLVMETTICRGEDTAFWDMGVFDNLHLKKRVLQERLRKRITQDLAKVCKDTIRLNPIDGMAGIEVIVPADVEVTALSEEAKTRVDSVSRTDAKTDKSSIHCLRRRRSAELVDAADEASGSNVGQGIRITPGTIFRTKDPFEGNKRPCTPLPDSDSSDLDERAHTPPSPSPAQRDKRITRAPIPPQSANEDIDDGAHTPPTPEGGFASIFREKFSPKDSGSSTQPFPEGGFPAIAEDSSHQEDDGARTPPSPTESNVMLPDTEFYPIEEEENNPEGDSQRTVLRTPQKPSNRATALLAAMTLDNLRASDIPSFTATRVWAGEETESASVDDDLERTLTPRTFRRAEIGRSAQNAPKEQDSDESLRTALFAAPVHQSMDLAAIAEPVDHEAGERLTTTAGSKAETEDAQLGESPLSQGRLSPSNMLTQAEAGQDSRVPSGETTTGSNGESDERSYGPDVAERLYEGSMTPRSSLSSQPIGVFPRRRSDQTQAIGPRGGAMSNSGRRHFTCPVAQHTGLHQTWNIEPGLGEAVLPSNPGVHHHKQSGSESASSLHDSK